SPPNTITPFFFTDPPTPEIYTLSLHDALPISLAGGHRRNTWQSVARQLMPDWQELLRQRLSGLALAAEERGDVHAELAAHLEERSEEHTSELQSRFDLVCRLLLEKKKTNTT